MDRREYERINVDAKGTFIVKRDGHLMTEFIAKIVDISEKGIRIGIDDENSKKKAMQITKDNTISFQAMEEFELYHKNTFQYFTGEVEIIHMTIDNDVIFLGCRLPSLSESLEKYITDRKVSVFISRISNEV